MDDPNKIAQNVFDKSLNDSQFGVSAIPYHQHTGTDSPQISYNNLTDQPSFLTSNISGAILAYGGSTAPTGYLLCDGTSYLRTTYQNLFNIIGTKFGSVDGTHFNVPDMRANVPAGYKSGDSNFGTLGGAVGSPTHTLTVAELPAHHHDIFDSAGTSVGTGVGVGYSVAAGITGDTGGGLAHSIVQASLTVNFIIKT